MLPKTGCGLYTGVYGTHFKLIIKNLFGGRLAWALAHGTSEERKLLAQEEFVLVWTSRQGFFKP